MIEVKGRTLKVNMHRLEIKDNAIHWTKPDSITIEAPATLEVANKS
jgi:hypothetical protein